MAVTDGLGGLYESLCSCAISRDSAFLSLLLHIWTGRLRNSVLKSKNQTEIVRIVDIFRFDKFFYESVTLRFPGFFCSVKDI